ncbi:Glutamyl-Q tRNA(Asp) synthetase [Paenibacillus sp. JJ-223]|nr:Glutamyl-Q tRNA(Asp) synthetase [Paenibacillus sp. JJ-223]
MEAGFDKPKKETEHDLNREFVMARRENKQSRQDEDERSSTQGGSYLENLIREDVMAGRFQRPICTRFPPEPNGHLHIGSAYAIHINYTTAQTFEGTFHLRFDDTNPLKEDISYIESILKDMEWLGYSPGGRILWV